MRIRFDKNKVDSFHQFLLSEPYLAKCETHGRARVSRVSTLMGKPLQWMADQSKPSTDGNLAQSNRTDSKQTSPQHSGTCEDIGSNFLSRLVVSDKVSACGGESRSDCPGVGYPVFYSFVAQLKSWTWRPYSTNPTKKTFKWEFGKKSGGTLWTLLAPQIQDYPIKKICRGEHENDSSKRSCETPVFELKTLDQWIIPAILEKRLCSLSWKKIRASLNLLRQRRGLKLKNWISKKIFPQLIKLLWDGPLRHNQSVQLVQILKMSMSITMFASLSYDKERVG